MENRHKIKKDPYAALRFKEFLFFLNTRFFLTLSIQMQSVIVGWQVYEHTQNVFTLGMIGLAEAIPFILVSLFSGHVADTFNRKNILVIAVAFLLLSTSGLLYISWNGTAFMKANGVAPVFIIIILTGIIRGFIAPTFPSFMTQLVPRNLYANAATWNSSVWHVGAVIGPALAGFICAVSFAAAYAVSIVFICISILSLLLIRAKPMPQKVKGETLKQSLTVGIRFVFNHQLILAAMSLDLFAVLFGGAVAMLPAYADEILHTGAEGLGFLRAAPAIGAVVTAIILAYAPPGKNAGRDLLLCVAGFGVATILFAVSTNFWLSLFFLFLIGAFDNVSVVIRHTILQLCTPDHMRGRVSAVNSIFIGSSNEIGAFESGLAARLMGLVPSVIFGGGMTILIVFFTGKLAHQLRKLNLEKLQ